MGRRSSNYPAELRERAVRMVAAVEDVHTQLRGHLAGQWAPGSCLVQASRRARAYASSRASSSA